jgi:phenylacetate-coenzyme A ligase PaaK-like adenylate-forming protein
LSNAPESAREEAPLPKPWDGLPARDQVRLQEALLREFVRRQVYPFSRFYRKVFEQAGLKPGDIRRLKDLERIPLTSREQFRADGDPSRPFQALLRPDDHSFRSWAHRSLMWKTARERLLRGDEAAERVLAEEYKPVHLHLPLSGGPVVGYTIRDLVATAQAGARMMAVMGATRHESVLSALPYGGDLGHWFTYYATQAAGMSGAHLGGGQAVRPSQVALWMGRLQASVFVTQPGYAEGLLRAAPPATFQTVKTLVLWGAEGMQGARSRFTTLLQTTGVANARVTALLSFPEARVAWAECPSPAGQPELSFGYHTYPDLEIVEIVDPATGNQVGEAEPGEIVYTSLDWRGSALLRFRTGLYARQGMVRTRCPGCGRSVPRIGADISRMEWETTTRDIHGDATYDLADVMPILWGEIDVPLWQLDVVRDAGSQGEDVVNALLAGGNANAQQNVTQALKPFRMRVRPVPFQDLRRRIGVGLERPETRVLIRSQG